MPVSPLCRGLIWDVKQKVITLRRFCDTTQHMRRILFTLLLCLTAGSAFLTSCRHADDAVVARRQAWLDLIVSTHNCSQEEGARLLDSLERIALPADRHERVLCQLAQAWFASIKANQPVGDSLIVPLVSYLEEHGILKRDGKLFNRSRLRDLVINPVYVKADYQVYDFFKAQGTNIANIPEDFIGTNGAYLYSGDTKKRKTVSLEGHTLVIAPHEGLVDSKTWIKCRSKCLNNQSVAKPVKAKATWLAGKIKCAHCGYALTAKIYRCKTKTDNRYYLCNNKYNAGGCNFGSLDADIVDGIVFEEMQKKLAEFKILSPQKREGFNLQVVKLKTRIDAVDKEISSLLGKITEANESVMQYINNRIAELDAEKKELYAQIVRCDDENRKDNIGEISCYMEHWDELSISDKITVVDCLIERITASKESIEIKWKI